EEDEDEGEDEDYGYVRYNNPSQYEEEDQGSRAKTWSPSTTCAVCCEPCRLVGTWSDLDEHPWWVEGMNRVALRSPCHVHDVCTACQRQALHPNVEALL